MKDKYLKVPDRRLGHRCTAMMASTVVTTVVTTLMFLDVLAQPPGPPAESLRVVTVAEGLRNPWSIAFLPNGDMLVTERGGSLRIVRDGRLLADSVPGVPAVCSTGQGGLHEVLPHPRFESNQLLYLSYAKSGDDPSQGTTAISRGRLVDDRLIASIHRRSRRA